MQPDAFQAKTASAPRRALRYVGGSTIAIGLFALRLVMLGGVLALERAGRLRATRR